MLETVAHNQPGGKSRTFPVAVDCVTATLTETASRTKGCANASHRENPGLAGPAGRGRLWERPRVSTTRHGAT